MTSRACGSHRLQVETGWHGGWVGSTGSRRIPFPRLEEEIHGPHHRISPDSISAIQLFFALPWVPRVWHPWNPPLSAKGWGELGWTRFGLGPAQTKCPDRAQAQLARRPCPARLGPSTDPLAACKCDFGSSVPVLAVKFQPIAIVYKVEG